MYAALTTAALFTGVILNDLYSTYDMMTPLKHFLFGFVATILMGILEAFGYTPVAWSLLIVPLAIISSIFVSVLWNPPVPKPPAASLVPTPPPKKEAPKLQLPDTPFKKTICEEVDAMPADYKPPELVQCAFATDGAPIMPAAEPTVGPFPVSQPVVSTGSVAAPAAKPEVTTTTQLNALANAVKLNLTPVTTCA